jgi:hypothetical protein
MGGDTLSESHATAFARRQRSRELPGRDLVAIALAGIGALMLFLSLLFDWVQLAGGDPNDTWVARAGIEDIPAFGTAYIIGVMFLVALFVGVIVLPNRFASAARVLGVGWAMGLAGVLAAVVVRAANSAQLLTGGPMASVVDAQGIVGTVHTSWLFGLYDAAAALVVMVVAFAVACPPLRDIE